MTDADGHRVEAALQYGFAMTNDDGDRYACTEEQLIMFAKACERAGLARAIKLLREREKTLDELCERSDLEWNDAQKTLIEIASGANKASAEILEQQRDALSTTLLPFVEAERVRQLTAAGYVRDESGQWVKP